MVIQYDEYDRAYWFINGGKYMLSEVVRDFMPEENIENIDKYYLHNTLTNPIQ